MWRATCLSGGMNPGGIKLMEPLPLGGRLGSEHPSACKPDAVPPTPQRGRISPTPTK